MKTVLIIAATKRDFEACRDTYSRKDQSLRIFRHVTCREDLQGYQAPIEVRFCRNWEDLEDAPKLEWIAEELQKDRDK